jgi:transposase
VKFYYPERAKGLIEEAWARVLRIPTYSPDFNPVEEAISQIGDYP